LRGDALPVNTGQHRHGYADDSHSEGEKGIITDMAAVQPANAAYHAADGSFVRLLFSSPVARNRPEPQQNRRG